MDDSALKSLIDCLDAQRTSLIWHLNGWTWLVAAGVLCEVVFIIWSHRDEFKEWKKALADAAIPFPSRPSRLKLVLEILSVGLVVGGIVGELNFEAKLGDMDNRIQSANNQRVALLRGESDAQRLRAAGLEKEAAQLRKDAATLENRMLDMFGSRVMSPAQSAQTAKNLRDLTGTKVDVFVLDLVSAPNSDKFKDSVKMGRSIRSTLRAAYLDADGWIADSCIEGAGATGLSVAVSNEATNMDEYFGARFLRHFLHRYSL
ncbi:MAG: hypothetical protein WCF17_16210 [Terracidiphilus sp.]